MNRRGFLKTASIAVALRPTIAAAMAASDTRINSVLGPLSGDSLGRTLMHEHILTDFIGAARTSPGRYDAQEVVRIALPHLQEARALGCATLVECTPDYMGRNPGLLATLSESSGLHIVTNTGLYGAAGGRDVPRFAYAESAQNLAARWTREFRDGIPPTGIRPGFIKTGVDAGPLTELGAKLIAAAALAHQQTGLVIVSHTGDGVAALAQLGVLDKYGVQPGAFVWAHAQDEKDTAFHRRAADRGAWVEFDGVSAETSSAHTALVVGMKKAGHLERTLVSQDSGAYRVDERGGGAFRGYGFMFSEFVPALMKAGLGQRDVDTLLIRNPRAALTPAR